jgi:hypothetical protein
MNRFRWLAVLLLTASASSLASNGARAEGFADLYLGGAFEPDTQSTIKALNRTASGKVNFDGAMLYGGRGGYWLESVPWLGLAATASYYNADEKGKGKDQGGQGGQASRLELDVIPVSTLLMLRYPLLKSADFPQGQAYPYLGIGPALFVTKARQQLDQLNAATRQMKDTNVEVGVDLRAGIGFFFPNDSWFYFTEYRFTHVGSSYFNDDVNGMPAELRLGSRNTQSFAFGIGFHF